MPQDPSYTAGGNVNQSHYEEQCGDSSKNQKQSFPMIQSPGQIYPDKTVIQKDTHTPKFTGAKTREHPDCPSTDEQIKVWHMRTTEYYSAMEMNEIMPSAATRMDPESIIPSEVSQTETDKYHMTSLVHGI